MLADAGYGNDTTFRSGLTERGLRYVVGVQSLTSARSWPRPRGWTEGASFDGKVTGTRRERAPAIMCASAKDTILGKL